jgi:hypothetical protein
VILPRHGFDIQTTGAVIFGRSAKRSRNALPRPNSSGNRASHLHGIPIEPQSRHHESQPHSLYGVRNVDISTLLAIQPESSTSTTVQRQPIARTTRNLPLTHALMSAPFDRRPQGPRLETRCSRESQPHAGATRLQKSSIPKRMSALRTVDGSSTSSFTSIRDNQDENTETRSHVEELKRG